jgi:hypothetical protein
MRRAAVLSVIAALLVVAAPVRAAGCDGAWIRDARLRTRTDGTVSGRLAVSVVRAGVTPASLLGAGPLDVDVLDGANVLGAPIWSVDVGADAFTPRGRSLRSPAVTIAPARDQDDAVLLKVRVSGAPAALTASTGLRVRVRSEASASCALTCVVPCRATGKRARLVCKAQHTYVPAGDGGVGAFHKAGSRRARMATPFCPLVPDLAGGCDPLIAEKCILPYPTDTFLAADASTPTGHRLAYPPGSLLTNTSGKRVDPTDWNTLDGYSPGSMIIALFPDTGAPVDPSATNVAFYTDYARSLDDDHPTVLLDTVTGERVPHFAEMDANTDDVTKRALIIRPARRLENGRRYVVAIRNLVDANGTPIEPRLVFRALRDGLDAPTDVCGSPCGAFVDRFGERYDRIFADLAAAGVARDDLLLAWDFTTASDEALTGWMVSIRDQAFALPTPSFTVTSVDDGDGSGFNANIFRRVQGTFQAPLFMTADAPASRLNLVDGVPTQNGFATVPFVVDIPYSALPPDLPGTFTYEPARASLWGHGLLGDRSQVDGLADFANANRIVMAGVDMQGMSSADVVPAVLPITSDLSNFHFIPERLHQGILNHLLLGRLLADPVHGFDSDPAFQFTSEMIPVIDTSRVYYSGGSQGGIFGLTIMAVATNFERGFLAVPGANYSTMLRRAAPFKLYLDLLRPHYPDRLDETIGIALIQQLWDRADPIAYLPHILPGDLSDPPVPHRVLLHMSTCDSQVSNVATEIAVRSLGIPQIAPPLRSFFDVPESATPVDGSALQEIDWQRCNVSRCDTPAGLDAGDVCLTDADCPGPNDVSGGHADRTVCDSGRPPLGNLIPRFDNGAHGAEGDAPGDSPVAQQADRFLRPGGLIEPLCDGPCDPF